VTSCTPERVTAARQRMSYRCHVQRRTCHRASGSRWDTKIQLGLRRMAARRWEVGGQPPQWFRQVRRPVRVRRRSGWCRR
jgi:hypothetical protein